MIHKSRVGGAFNDEGPGIRVRDLARVTEFPTSIWSGIRLLFLRMSIRGAGRAARGGYECVFYCSPTDYVTLLTNMIALKTTADAPGVYSSFFSYSWLV